MTKAYELPRQVGQLVWCPQDPTLGIGVVAAVESSQIRVKFLRLQEERSYTTRSAEPIIVRYQIASGERVRNRGDEEHRVRHRLEAERKGLAIYELEDGEQIVESELVPEVRDIGAMERLATLTLAHPEVVRARVQGLDLTKLGKRPGRAAVLGARVQWLPHQIDVACRAIERDPVRMLLADEVGLGKTVEAALIYAGLRHEGRARRVLILTPESLTIQWLGELFRKTHELLVLLDDERIDDAATDMPELGAFEAYQRVVASIDRIAKDPDLAAQCVAAQWDLVIVDEAHHLKWKGDKGAGNAAYRLVEGLARGSRHMLLLTATPMALDPAEYHALLRLLDPTRFDDPSAFESIAQRASIIRDVGRQLGAALEGTPLTKAFNADAQKVLEDDPDDLQLLERFVKAKPSAKDYKEIGGRVLEALLHRHGLADYVVRNRRGPVGGLPQRKALIVPLEPSAKQDTLIEVGEGVMFDLVGSMSGSERNTMLGKLLRALWATPRALADILMPISPALVKELTPLIDEVTRAPHDKKGLPTGDTRLRWLVEQLRGLATGDKLLVFVETQVAVTALRDALEPFLGQNVAVFHRGLSARDQDRQVAWFRDPSGPKVMLSTEAGGEGRNFQFCNQVVLYDLPWRPATIEQRIGRIDRVGQTRDVHVLVPFFKSGYEAAILKVMQESIGVLDKTVGGIDHQLEYVSDHLADLVLQSARGKVKGGAVEGWKALYRETDKLVGEARARVDNDVDVILDHASFSPERAKAILSAVPANLEERLEEFVQRFAEHTKVALKARGNGLYAVEGAPGAAGRVDDEASFIGTFSRTYALDHEDVELLSFGHPLVVQALEWAREAHDASAALALARGFDRDGAAFLWRYAIDLPDDVPQVATYFDDLAFIFALDESGKRVPELEQLLTSSERPLDRMDPAPLRSSVQRWRKLVDQNHEAAQQLADELAHRARDLAASRLKQIFTQRERDLRRAQARELQSIKPKSKQRKDIDTQHDLARRDLAEDKQRITTAIENAMPRLQAVVAVRLMRVKQVSG